MCSECMWQINALAKINKNQMKGMRSSHKSIALMNRCITLDLVSRINGVVRCCSTPDKFTIDDISKELKGKFVF